MPETNRDEDGRPFCTEVHSGARVRVALSPDADQAMVSFDYRNGEPINILIALDVFPHLVEMIQFAGLAEATPTRRAWRRLSPSEGALPGLVARKAPGDGDGA